MLVVRMDTLRLMELSHIGRRGLHSVGKQTVGQKAAGFQVLLDLRSSTPLEAEE